MTTMIKYEFGETPADLIRGAIVTRMVVDDTPPQIHGGELGQFTLGSTGLLTVLDALREVCMIGPRADNPNDPAWRLRIEILAALGIDER